MSKREFFFLTGVSKKANEGLERRLCSQKHLLFLQKIHVWFPEPTWWLTTICNSSSGGPDTLFWPPSVYKRTFRQNTLTHKIIKKDKWEKHLSLSIWRDQWGVKCLIATGYQISEGNQSLICFTAYQTENTMWGGKYKQALKLSDSSYITPKATQW